MQPSPSKKDVVSATRADFNACVRPSVCACVRVSVCVCVCACVCPCVRASVQVDASFSRLSQPKKGGKKFPRAPRALIKLN